MNYDNIVCAYMFGSRVYRSNDSESDNDYILVTDVYQEPKTVNEHVYTKETFQQLLDNHDIQALECHFLPSPFIITKNHEFSFSLNLHKLRTSISTIASNSFVKGKKKIIVTGDYDLRAGIKSVFHSLRILDFGIQIALNGKIENYSNSNWILEDLWKLAGEYQRLELWQKIETKYKPLYNKRSSEFKRLAPKDTQERNRPKEFEKVLWKYKIDPELYEGLVDDLMDIK